MMSFYHNIVAGMRGDYNHDPQARRMVFLFVVFSAFNLVCAFFAAFVGLPAYLEIMAKITLEWFAYLLVLIVALGAFSASGILSWYGLEKLRFRVSRFANWVAISLGVGYAILVCFDVYQNYNGANQRIDESHKTALQSVNGQAFVWQDSRSQQRLDHLTKQIDLLDHAQCKGNWDCSSGGICPKVPGSAAHNQFGRLEPKGIEFRNKLDTEREELRAERKEAFAAWSENLSLDKKQINRKTNTARTGTYILVFGLYILMLVNGFIIAACMLAFEQAVGIEPDYLAIAQERTAQKLHNRNRRKQIREQARQVEDERLKELAASRARKRASLKPVHTSPPLSYQSAEAEKIARMEALLQQYGLLDEEPQPSHSAGAKK